MRGAPPRCKNRIVNPPGPLFLLGHNRRADCWGIAAELRLRVLPAVCKLVALPVGRVMGKRGALDADASAAGKARRKSGKKSAVADDDGESTTVPGDIGSVSTASSSRGLGAVDVAAMSTVGGDAPSLPMGGDAPEVVVKELQAALDGDGGLPGDLARRIHALGGVGAWSGLLDEAFPPVPGVEYVTQQGLAQAGHAKVRLQQLAFHKLTGNSGVIVQEDMTVLVKLIALNGFCTDPFATQGTEALSAKGPDPELVSQGPESWTGPYKLASRNLAPIGAVWHVKGWRRSLAALFVATVWAQRWGAELAAMLPPAVFQSFQVVHAAMRVLNAQQSIAAARELTLQSTRTRQAPNCFNHLHQICKLQAVGVAGSAELKVWNSQRGIMKEFAIGPAEASAALNMAAAPAAFCEKMQSLVEKFGFSKKNSPLTHAGLAVPQLAVGKGPVFTSKAWTDGSVLADEDFILLAERIEADYLAKPPALRKPLNAQGMGEKLRQALIIPVQLKFFESPVPQAPVVIVVVIQSGCMARSSMAWRL